MMKKLLIPILMLICYSTQAQLNNQWIDHSKTYFKFKVNKDSLTRIPQSLLAANGMGNVNADHFQLWRNGEEVRIYTSVSNAILGSSDYIEFWGEMNDGKADKALYRKPEYQLNNKFSLFSDTATYFLTINPEGGNLRFINTVNSSPSATPPDAYFMRNVDTFYKFRINYGLAYPLGQYVYSSSFDVGEGWASYDIGPLADFNITLRNLNVYTAGPANSLSIRLNASGLAPNERSIRIKIYDTDSIYGIPMPFFTDKKIELNNLPLSKLQNADMIKTEIGAVGNNIPSLDRFVVHSFGLTYPARFKFNNRKNFDFNLAASATGNNLLIEDFAYGSVAPILYDFSEGKRYVGDIISTPGRVRFVLPASTNPERKFLLINAEGNSVRSIKSLQSKTFTNYLQATNQGNYIIISNPALYNDGNGVDQVNKFKEYRNSAVGGNFDAKIYDINELTDQFGFGIKNHPACIRDFLQFADQQFAVKPQYVFIIGRGVNYMDQWNYASNPLLSRMDFVPTFGWPASDVLLAAKPGTTVPLFPIGRLAAINGAEINNYLQKVIQYEQTQQSTSPNIADKAWMKNAMHVVGGADGAENQLFLDYMKGYENIMKDTLFGGKVETFSKTSAGSVQEANSKRIEDLFQTGLGFIGYFGHSSANTFEFNLSDPSIYNNTGKYPFFNVSGCSAGNFFIFDPLRVSGNLTLSEKYVLANQKGSIGFLADTHFGVPPYLDDYNKNFYTEFSNQMYGQSVGKQIKKVIVDLGGNNPGLEHLPRLHLEELSLHGDPAIKINYFGKPDYVVDDPSIRINPTIVTVADNNFEVAVKMHNIGKAIKDSMFVSVKWKLPNDTIKVLYDKLIPAIRNQDSLKFTLPINPVTDKGLNEITVSLDYTNRIDETFENNNVIKKSFYIFEDELKPASPYNFSIVSKQNIEFIASTANPISGQRQYVMEIDTTELFNSAFKQTHYNTGNGGVIQFKPTSLTFQDSTVYYWRVATVPLQTEAYIWNSFSFVYLPNSSPGFNQSHYYQFKKSTFNNIELADNRKFNYVLTPRSLTFRYGMHPFFDYDKINVNLDFDQLDRYGCYFNSLQIYVFDPNTLKPWVNENAGGSGMYGSAPVCAAGGLSTRKFFEFPYGIASSRKAAMDFIDLIPAGMYISIANLGNSQNNTSFINQWKADEGTLGTGNSLYHKLKSIGFTQIDSFYKNRPFLFFYKKGDASLEPTQIVGDSASSYIDKEFILNSIIPNGSIESPVYGPVKKWSSLHWRGTSTDANPQTDSVKVEVWGVNLAGAGTKLATIAPAQDSSLSFVDAAIYPFIQLKVFNKDTLHLTPHQLRYLRINADPVPEGAVAPNLLFALKDTAVQGEEVQLSLAFKNISQYTFDSLLRTKITIKDRNNIDHVIEMPKRKTLAAGDTLYLNYTINTTNYPGSNIVFVDFNPDDDQPEQYHYNNVFFKELYVKADNFNPLMDVTFDAVHILNRDIVAAKPNILIKLKDESKFMSLKDTSLVKVQVRFPDDNQTLRTYHFDSDTMRFIPADLSTGENTASIEFKPYFPLDGEYELMVSGKDAVGNVAGEMDYKVVFSVINKPMISNMLNYPNPFTTSTAFVFTVTGMEVPQNIRIQILTITGKVVREITKEELGPIHIGRNITEYKWDGTDMYGQKLANGVYLYRVLTNLNGKSLDKYKANGDNTDKFFNKGYGKMYLMR